MLCTRAQVKDAIGIPGTADDARIDALISEASQTIMRRYGREFVPHTTASRTYKVARRLVSLAPHDLRSATAVVLHPEATTPQTLIVGVDYTLLPSGGADGTGTFTQLLLAGSVSLASSFMSSFGFAQIRVDGAWGVWAGAATVREDVRRGLMGRGHSRSCSWRAACHWPRTLCLVSVLHS